MNVELNQEIVIVTIGNNARYGISIYPAKVSKIGRKWFEVTTKACLGNHNKFSLENGKCDGGKYMSEWEAFESEEAYKEASEKPNVRKEIERNLYGLTYKQLTDILNLIKNYEK